ncbi:hypothetical protein BDA99DRAFT_540531 [Phascolomyces articulosus]|uniref:Uncharacterized protein n=1 Tax=Phascolomyces articulosus TaxID=60185 RepID=A0AAD5JUA9_9FUNG|nr:hypothetical protein BDA99DRAFT_540531 [Phascolomyces articulosus]
MHQLPLFMNLHIHAEEVHKQQQVPQDVTFEICFLCPVLSRNNLSVCGSYHIIDCFHLYESLEINKPITIDLIPFILNKLPTKPVQKGHIKQCWCWIWSRMCELLFMVDLCCHLLEDISSCNDPDPGRSFIRWLESNNHTTTTAPPPPIIARRYTT